MHFGSGESGTGSVIFNSGPDATKGVAELVERYVDKAQVRVYIKDTILKPYGRRKLQDPLRSLRVLRVPEGTKVSTTYRQPHGLAFEDGRVIAWGRADDWRGVLMALHERTFGANERSPYAAVLMQAEGRFSPEDRALVEDAAKKLGVGRVVWLDT